MKPIQLELGLSISPDVQVTRLPDGEVRMKPRAPLVHGSTKDAARVLGCCERTVRNLIAEGELVAWRPAKRWLRVDMASVYDKKKRSVVA